MVSQGAYESTLNNIVVENIDGRDQLIKEGEVLLSVGDEFTDNVNNYRSYKCISIDLHFIRFEKISVGSFELDQVGKCQEFQTVHFIENELNLVKNS